MQITPRLDSALDLTLAIQELRKEYNITDFETDVQNAGIKLTNQSWESVSLNTADKTQKILQRLMKKYKYGEFHIRCMKIKNAFLHRREEYLYPELVEQFRPLSFFIDDSFSETIFESWVRNSLVEHSQQSSEPLAIRYESLSGTLKTLYALHKDVVLTEDFVEALPIPYWEGSTSYDSFKMVSFWDSETDKPVAIPLLLIRYIGDTD